MLRSSVPPLLQPDTLIGTAGTITTLASVDQRLSVYDRDRINGATLTRESVNDMVHMLSRCTIRDRRSIPGLEPGREDIILAGAVILQEIMDHWEFRDLLVSDGGLREGILIDLYAKMIHRE
jgi:exopolyphosphatase/guanosine-5'-triphosphate,3'-diphosphate pyrophosphatase